MNSVYPDMNGGELASFLTVPAWVWVWHATGW